MASFSEINRLFHYRNLLNPSLKGKDINKKWEPQEKIILAQNIKKVWENSMWKPRQGQALNFNAVVIRGKYKDKEPFALKKNNVPLSNKKIDILANLETVDDIHALRAYLDEINNPQSTLATRFFPLERGDKPGLRYSESGEEKHTEILLLRRELRDLTVNNVRRLIISNSHSPALAFFLLEAGIPVVDVISLPAMFDFALEQGFFGNKTIVPVTGDYGAGAMGELLEKLTAEKNISSENSIHALKTKSGNETKVHFDSEQLKRINGKTAVIPEDILATGGTLKDTAEQLIEAGAEEVIIMVSFPLFANNALERLGNNPKIKIITTDGFTPQTDISQANNIYIVLTAETFASILELDKQGVNFFSPQGKAELRDKGFCLNPWMDV